MESRPARLVGILANPGRRTWRDLGTQVSQLNLNQGTFDLFQKLKTHTSWVSLPSDSIGRGLWNFRTVFLSCQSCGSLHSRTASTLSQKARPCESPQWGWALRALCFDRNRKNDGFPGPIWFPVYEWFLQLWHEAGGEAGSPNSAGARAPSQEDGGHLASLWLGFIWSLHVLRIGVGYALSMNIQEL